MVKTVRSAAVYVRISLDQDGTALGVARQEADCRELADRLEWPVGEVYCDNDVSAYSGKRRPAYERMLGDLAEGARDAVIVYHGIRLTRRPIELEQFLAIVERAGVRQVRFVAGADVDIANGDGLLVLRMLAAVAANESASKSRRVRRRMLENARAGLPHGGSHRPFGFLDDRITHDPAEAELVRTIVARFVAGESVRSLTRWLHESGARTVAGGAWTTTSVKGVLVSPRIAGLREHQGEVIGQAVWAPIITPAEHERVKALFAERARTGKRSPRRYLLSGLCRCGKCAKPLYSAPRETTRRYVCVNGPDKSGCGRLTVVVPALEELLVEAVLYRLDTPEIAAAMLGQTAEDDVTARLSEEVAADRAQLDELARIYAEKAIGVREWMAARQPIEARIADAERRMLRIGRNDALAGVVGNGTLLRGTWEQLDLSRQAGIIAAVVDHVTIAPGVRGARALDPQRVQITWRL